jgi:hypothetical protein
LQHHCRCEMEKIINKTLSIDNRFQMSSETDLSRNQAIQNQRNSFLRGFPLLFNVETLQAFRALSQIPHYYRKFLHCKSKMLCYFFNYSNYIFFINFFTIIIISIKWGNTVLNVIMKYFARSYFCIVFISDAN